MIPCFIVAKCKKQMAAKDDVAHVVRRVGLFEGLREGKRRLHVPLVKMARLGGKMKTGWK